MAKFDLKMETVVDKYDEVVRLIQNDIEKALEACGMMAEELAAGKCPVDTGLLRNSITYALDGQGVKQDKYKSNSQDKNGNPIEVKTGFYAGETPKEDEGARSVTIGTNVEYGPFIELGTSKRNPKPFLRPAVEEHKEDYIEIIRRYCKTP